MTVYGNAQRGIYLNSKARQPRAGVLCCLDGLRGAILAGGTPLEEAVGRPQNGL